MLKKILFGVALLATFTACTDDYTDWSSPQANAQEDAVTFGDGSVSSVSLIDFANITDDQTTVQVCNMQAPTASDATYSPVYKINLGSSTYDLDESGSMSVAELKDYVETNYGKAPTQRDIDATVEMWLSNGTTAVKTATSGTFTVSALLVAPYISEHYYLIGAPSAWSPTETSMPFSHSETNVYDDPVFTITFPVEDGQTWFAIADDKTVASGDWSDVLGCKEGNGNNGMSGNIARRTDLSDDGSWVINVDGDAKYVKMTINMMDYTYTLEKINFSEYVYLPGDANSWSFDQDFLRGANYDGEYLGFAMIGGTWGWKITTEQNWDVTAYGAGSADGVIALGGGNIMEGSTATLYYANVNLVNLTYALTPITSVSIIGAPTGDSSWGTDLDLTQSSDNQKVWTYTGHLEAGEFKFRMNHGWDVNLGGASADALEQNGANLSIATAGDYTITLTLSANGVSSYTIQ